MSPLLGNLDGIGLSKVMCYDGEQVNDVLRHHLLAEDRRPQKMTKAILAEKHWPPVQKRANIEMTRNKRMNREA